MAGSRTLKLSILADVDDLKKKLDVGSKEVEGFSGQIEKFGKVAAAAFAAAAAAALAYAGKLAVEGVKAAIADEAAQKRLATALENVTGATEEQIKAVEQQITKTSLATGVADDKLRPALQKLTTATEDVAKAQDLMQVALDVAAGTGKDVVTVSAALAKAYDGNYSSLTRLGVGITATEAKTLGFNGVVSKLSDNFRDSATKQANTLEGQITRLSVAFDEAKESVGTALLPMLKTMIDYFVNTLIPKFQEAKAAAIDPIVTAFKNNEAALRDLWSFIKTYLVPIFETALVGAIKSVGATIAGIITIVGTVTSKVKELANDVIDAVNKIIRAYNAIPILPNISTIPNIGTSSTAMTGSIPTANLPFGGASIVTPTSGASNAIPSTSASITATTKTVVPIATGVMPTYPTGGAAGGPITVGSNFNPGSFRMAENAGMVTINVNSPSIIDREGFSRAVVDALNQSADRGTGGGNALLML